MFDLLRSDNLYYRLWFGDRHTTKGSFVPSKVVFSEGIGLALLSADLILNE